MLPTTEEILNQIVLLWQIRNEVEPVDPITMGAIGKDLMYPPIFIINALDLGKKLGVLEHDYKSDVLKVLKEPVLTFMGTEIARLMNAFEDKVKQLNGKEEDINLGLLQQWCMGVRPTAAELALRRLVLDGVLYEYDLKDPKDTKSVYTFYTLAENKDEQWGLKQFKETKKDV